MTRTIQQLTNRQSTQYWKCSTLHGNNRYTAIGNKNTTSAEGLRSTLKNKVEEVHDLKITVQEMKIEAEQAKGEILEWSAQIEESVGYFQETISR